MTLSCCKKISALFCKITSKHDEDFYFSNRLHSFRTENELQRDENKFKNHGYCWLLQVIVILKNQQ